MPAYEDYQTPESPSSSTLPSSFWIPPLFAQHGLVEVHHYPDVMDKDKNYRGSRPVQTAWRDWPRVELHPTNSYTAFIIDVDEPTESGWYGKPRILPTWQVMDNRTGKFHLVYALESPVHKNLTSRNSPLLKYANIGDRLNAYLGGDPSNPNRITRSPIHDDPDTSVHWFSYLPYTLAQLDKRLPKLRSTFGHRLSGIGRNCDLFYSCVKIAHRPSWHRSIVEQGWDGPWLEFVRNQNAVMHPEDPLPDVECRSVAKSCAGYSLRNYDQDQVNARQRRRNLKRWHGDYDFDIEDRNAGVRALRKIGLSQAQIAEEFGIGQQHVSRILRIP